MGFMTFFKGHLLKRPYYYVREYLEDQSNKHGDHGVSALQMGLNLVSCIHLNSCTPYNFLNSGFLKYKVQGSSRLCQVRPSGSQTGSYLSRLPKLSESKLQFRQTSVVTPISLQWQSGFEKRFVGEVSHVNTTRFPSDNADFAQVLVGRQNTTGSISSLVQNSGPDSCVSGNFTISPWCGCSFNEVPFFPLVLLDKIHKIH